MNWPALHEQFERPFLSIDAAILRAVTRASHAVQSITGASSYRQTAWAILAWGLAAIIDVADYWLPSLLDRRQDGLGLTLSLLVVPISLWVIDQCFQADREFTGRTLPRAALRIRMLSWSPVLRVLMVMLLWPWPAVMVLIVMRLQWLEAFHNLGLVGLVASLYLCLVVPRPPGPSAFARWREAIAAGLALKPTETPA